jgi:hypothetical protein
MTRSPLRLGLALALLVAAMAALAIACGPDNTYIWLCFDPGTGHEGAYYDSTHYVSGVFDPCHCYDPCGPADTCPILVDAGPPPADAGCALDDGGDAGDRG